MINCLQLTFHEPICNSVKHENYLILFSIDSFCNAVSSVVFC